ncbi:MAG: proline--tRNA ligase [Candidatus Pacebacteria bacterium]|nr:proline--tRNA ligase [Candidatus Paceibacterota bacterium]
MNKIFEKKELKKKSENFSEWYTDVILKSKLADYAPVKGCMVIRPYGYALWENIQKDLDIMIKQAGVKNAYFPLFIPYSFLEKEKKHVKGFSPQLAVVTHGGGKKLAEPLVVRPTSETVMYSMFAKWIKSWRDLPLLINQWCNIVRWEKRTYLFLRTMEFLWQEGHTAHATQTEAKKEVLRALKMYQDFVEKFLAIPVMVGKKSESEKFPGGDATYAFEPLMPDGKALQGGTSHELGQNFSKVFDVKFQNKKGKPEYVWQTSWGFTTRIIGALVMIHGDDSGLIMPPKIAPIQVVIIPILDKKKGNNKKILVFAEKIKKELVNSGIRTELDARKQHSPGWKFNEWEIKGVPLRIEVGKQEVAKNQLTIARRDTGKKIQVKSQRSKIRIKDLLDEIQNNLYKKAEKSLKENTRKIENYQEFKEIMKTKKGFIWAFWCEDPKCEQKIKTETKATTRLLPLNAKQESGKCIYCKKPSQHRWLFAQAY